MDIVALVAADPECGDVIRGTGGFRKVRVAQPSAQFSCTPLDTISQVQLCAIGHYCTIVSRRTTGGEASYRVSVLPKS